MRCLRQSVPRRCLPRRCFSHLDGGAVARTDAAMTILKTVAQLFVLLYCVVPYSAPSLAAINVPCGFLPSPSKLGNACRIVKPPPSGFSLNVVPPPFFPTFPVVP